MIAGTVAGKELLLRQGSREVKVQSKGQVAIDGAEAAVSALRAGIGIAVASQPSFSEDAPPATAASLEASRDRSASAVR